ncbi:sugar phosphate isomerase/epimerase family protein [Mariniflexile sp.]|uniref:sugar phosphate isomerase/epimerase family protein n=1 Tax=Mariniflexile sp. TaxID=1979402 RepID=UPI004047E15D
MIIEFYCPRWGSEHLEWDVFLKNVKDAGFDGVEYALASIISKEELRSISKKLKDHNLKLILQHFDTYEPDFNKHDAAYANWFDLVKNVEVVKINSQTGKDFFSFEENNQLLALAEKFAKANNIEICHETHRNKFSFACHITKPFLETNPELKITLDVSHWVAVAESYLEDQAESMALALSRTEHIHARVGHTQGPQVTDPRAPEWQEALNHHLLWWDKIIERKKLNNDDVLTITTEFGPPPYMVTEPFTSNPLASQWDINVYIKDLLKERYN